MAQQDFKSYFFDFVTPGRKTFGGMKKLMSPFMGQWLKTTDRVFEAVRYGVCNCDSWVICYKQKPTKWLDSSKGARFFGRESMGVAYPISNYGCAFMFGQIRIGKKKSYFQFHSACGNELGYDFWFPNEDLNKVKKFIMDHKNDHDFESQLNQMKNSYAY